MSFDEATTQASGTAGGLYFYKTSPRFVNDTAGGRKLLDLPQGQPRAKAQENSQTNIMQYITPDDNSQQKTFATTAPADCPAHRERPQAITSHFINIRDQKTIC
jgi:hypothetical protein